MAAMKQKHTVNLKLDMDLYVDVVKAAASEAARTGGPFSVSRWIREAITEKLGRATP